MWIKNNGISKGKYINIVCWTLRHGIRIEIWNTYYDRGNALFSNNEISNSGHIYTTVTNIRDGLRASFPQKFSTQRPPPYSSHFHQVPNVTANQRFQCIQNINTERNSKIIFLPYDVWFQYFQSSIKHLVQNDITVDILHILIRYFK